MKWPHLSHSLFLVLLVLAPAHGAPLAADEARLDQIAIQDQGRKKPFVTFARETLLTLTGRTSWKPSPDSPSLPAADVMLRLWLQPENWDDKPLILIGFAPLREELGFPRDRKLFSYKELVGNAALDRIVKETRRAKAQNMNVKVTRSQTEAGSVGQRITILEKLLTGQAFAVVPHSSHPDGTWVALESIASYYPKDKVMPVVALWIQFRDSFIAGDDAKFKKATADLASALRNLSPSVYPTTGILAFEHLYQEAHPFRWAWVIYALAAITLALTSSWKQKNGYRLGWALTLCGFGLQIFGFTSRIIISGRPPVTNMYETVIWVAFGTIFFAIILEAIYRCRYFLMAAAPVAVISLLIADMQPMVLNSSIHPLQAVLRDNFWLSTHVTSITLSYAAFALALGLAHNILGIILIKGRSAISPVLYLYLYRALQVGVLLLAIGTLLGGVWANYSWGRFWDWDPKETWALISLLCYLALLHGRIAGWWGGLGLAVGSVIGFQSVLMAWYGVNFVLGTGLHSYGFGNGGFAYVVTFVILELLFTAAALWRHSQPASKSSPEAVPV